jgi:hypothetical protein
MTQDEIIEMAIEAEFVSHGKPSDEESELFVCVDKDIYKFANLVAAKATAKEREACARVCEIGINNATDWDSSDWDQACENRAYHIRARGEA